MLSLSPNLLKFTSFSFLFAVQAGASPLLSEYHRYSARNNSLQWSDCSVGLPGRECTRFEVPLDWHNDTAGKASLAVIRYPATKQPKLGTLFMNPGGPGGSGLQNVQGAYGDTLMEYVEGKYDIVSWDPRGVGQTIPRAACFETPAEEDAFWKGSIINAGPEVRGNFTSQTDLDAFYSKLDESDALLQRLGEKCIAYSPNTFQYIGTAATVRDMVAMHDALEGPGKKIDFLVFSDRVGHVVLDGVVDPVYWTNRPAHELMINAWESIEATFDGFAKECANAGPSHCAIAEQNSTASSIRQWILDLIDAAYDYRQEIGASALLNSSSLRAELSNYMYTPKSWTNLSQKLYRIKAQFDNTTSLNTTQTKRWLQLFDSVGSMGSTHYSRQEPTSEQTTKNHNVPETGIGCADARDPGDVTTKDVFDTVVNVTHRITPTFGPLGVRFLSRAFCHRWPVRAVERYSGPWNKKPPKPILVIGNEADPVTPYVNAKSVADSFGSSAVLIKQAGYGVSVIVPVSSMESLTASGPACIARDAFGLHRCCDSEIPGARRIAKEGYVLRGEPIAKWDWVLSNPSNKQATTKLFTEPVNTTSASGAPQ
ncbi:MEROPS serine peptidase family S33, partial [Rhizoctonia solani]